LLVTDAGDGIDYDHADWCDARIELRSAVSPADLIIKRPGEPYVLTPKPSSKPKINCPKIFGVRPGNPLLFTIAATGKRPMSFSAKNLPEGLILDGQTGRITGKILKRGLYAVSLTAKNDLGEFSRELRISVGDSICLTPPMGWNSWNCWACAVDDGKVRASADLAKTPVLLTVGKMEPYRPEDGHKVKADGVIIKPFEASDLLAIVKKFEERIGQTAVPPMVEQAVRAESQYQEDATAAVEHVEHHSAGKPSSQPMVEVPDHMAGSAAFNDMLGADSSIAPHHFGVSSPAATFETSVIVPAPPIPTAEYELPVSWKEEEKPEPVATAPPAVTEPEITATPVEVAPEPVAAEAEPETVAIEPLPDPETSAMPAEAAEASSAAAAEPFRNVRREICPLRIMSVSSVIHSLT